MDPFFTYFVIGFPIFMVITAICMIMWAARQHRQFLHDSGMTHEEMLASIPVDHPRPGNGSYWSSSNSHGYGSDDHGQRTGWYADSHHGSSSDSGYSDSSSHSSSSCDTSSSSSSSDSSSSSSSSDSGSSSC